MKQPKQCMNGVVLRRNCSQRIFFYLMSTMRRKHPPILIKVLDDGITKLNEAQKSLLVSSQSFNNASGKLLALDSQLTNDFSEKSSFSSHR